MSSPSGRRPQRGGEAFPFFSSCLFAHGSEGHGEGSFHRVIRVQPIEVRPSGRKVRQGGVVGLVLLFRGHNGGARPTFGLRFGPSGGSPSVRMRGKASPCSAALPKRPGRRPQRGFLVHPPQSLRAARDRHRGRKPSLPSLPNRTAVEMAITPGGSTARRSRWNGGCDLRRGPAMRPCRRPQRGGAVRPDLVRSLYAVTVTNGVPAGGRSAVHPSLQARGRLHR